MNVLLLGGEGFIGARLAPMLRLKHKVSIFDLKRGQDICNRAQLDKAVKGQDVVIHLACHSNNDWCVANPKEARRVNMESIHEVIEACRNVKRFIFASSVAAYGFSDKPLTEDNPLLPTTPYGQGKAYCEYYLGQSRLPWIITRAATVCGWSPRMRHDTTVNKMVHDALTTGKIKVNGGGQYRCHIHIHDLCDAYSLLVDAKDIEGQTYNLVERNQTVKETANEIAFAVSGTAVEYGPSTDDRSYMVNGWKAKEFDFIPKRTVVDAVHDILTMHKAGEYA